MAGGVIDGFFRRPRAGQPLRSVANVGNLNRVANILNDISGEGCRIEKPFDGTPWVVRYDGQTSDNVPSFMPHTAEFALDVVNQAEYNSSSGHIRLVRPRIYVNGQQTAPYASLEYWWSNSDGLKYLYVYQHFYESSMDADGQYAPPDYIYTTQELDGSYPNFSLVSKIPYCRVEAGDPPQITCLLEGPLHLYCFRGDSATRAYAPAPIQPTRQIQTSMTTDSSSGGSLPLSVHNIGAAADGFFDEYPNGRWRVEQGEIVENLPDAEAKRKNDAKAVLLRYKAEGENGVPYWMTMRQFFHNAADWVEDYVDYNLTYDADWIVDFLHGIAWDLWQGWISEHYEFAPRVPEQIGGSDGVAAIMTAGGEWISIFDILVKDGELSEPQDVYDALNTRADYIDQHIADAVEAVSHVGELADESEGWIGAREDYTSEVAAHTAEAAQEAADAATMAGEFTSLDARITALEQRRLAQ